MGQQKAGTFSQSLRSGAEIESPPSNCLGVPVFSFLNSQELKGGQGSSTIDLPPATLTRPGAWRWSQKPEGHGVRNVPVHTHMGVVVQSEG